LLYINNIVSRETVSRSQNLKSRIKKLSLYSGLIKNSEPVSFSGLNTGLLSLLSYVGSEEPCGHLCLVSSDVDSARELYASVEDLAPGRVYIAIDQRADKEGLFSSEDRKNFEIFYSSVLKNKKGVYLATPEALCLMVSGPKSLEAGFALSVNKKFSREKIVTALKSWGYVFGDKSDVPMTASLRGGLLDIFPMYANYPLRIEFFGDVVETLRLFNPVSQLSFEHISNFTLLPPSGHKKVDGILLENLLSTNNIPFFYVNKKRGELVVSNTKKGVTPKHVSARIPDISSTNLKGHDVYVCGKVDQIKNLGHCSPKTTEAILHSGFYLKKEKLLVLGYSDTNQLKPVRESRHSLTHKTNTSRFNVQNVDLGDLIVHEDYGVGVYDGITALSSAKGLTDCVLIKYSNGSVTVFPEHFNKLYLYASSSGKISALGSKTWKGHLSRAKKSAELFVKDLALLYSERQRPRGFQYTNDNEFLENLSNSFPFEETIDQKKAINDVLEDLNKKNPMDRIVLGDVGFGKTEVAIRATMKAVSSGKQVFVVSPTTVLADQHFITFTSRLSAFGVRVLMLSRFITKKETMDTYEKISTRTVDVIIGTHKILSDKTDTKNLGLLIVDEEHRFGVKHKEYIRKLKRNVDVLTLTATPIPRTLQQSLVGLKDVSRIETPPKERLPIKTNVIRFSWKRVGAAIQRELVRNGQVYYLHNDIQSLPFVVEKIRKRFPRRTVGAAHGSLPSKDLEKTILAFFSGEISILVCTTIIESGLDVTNANTIIINNAHRLGLSQLYQIRGRVGRGKVQAYCWLQIPDRGLNKNAHARLRALEHYSTLGSGYEIASKDMEIRGSGNVFGHEQSGHINTVGYSLYCKLLQNQINNGPEKTTRNVSSFYPSVSFEGDCFFPEKFMSLAEDRLYYYQRLSVAKKQKDIQRVEGEIKDRFGALPEEVKNVLVSTSVKLACSNTLLKTITLNNKSLVLTFVLRPAGGVDVDRIIKAVEKIGAPYTFKNKKGFSLVVESAEMSKTVRFSKSIGKLLKV